MLGVAVSFLVDFPFDWYIVFFQRQDAAQTYLFLVFILLFRPPMYWQHNYALKLVLMACTDNLNTRETEMGGSLRQLASQIS